MVYQSFTKGVREIRFCGHEGGVSWEQVELKCVQVGVLKSLLWLREKLQPRIYDIVIKIYQIVWNFPVSNISSKKQIFWKLQFCSDALKYIPRKNVSHNQMPDRRLLTKNIWRTCWETIQNKIYFFHEVWVKSIRIRSFSGPYFPALGLNAERYSVFSPNAGKYGPEKLRIWRLFTQWKCSCNQNEIINSLIKQIKVFFNFIKT